MMQLARREPNRGIVPHARPCLGPDEEAAALRVLRSGRLAPGGATRVHSALRDDRRLVAIVMTQARRRPLFARCTAARGIAITSRGGHLRTFPKLP